MQINDYLKSIETTRAKHQTHFSSRMQGFHTKLHIRKHQIQCKDLQHILSSLQLELVSLCECDAYVLNCHMVTLACCLGKLALYQQMGEMYQTGLDFLCDLVITQTTHWLLSFCQFWGLASSRYI